MSRNRRWLAFLGLALLAVGWPGLSPGEEVTSAVNRYRDREASTGFYEEYEVRPGRMQPYVGGVAGPRQGVVKTSAAAAQVRVRTRLTDSHLGLPYYAQKSCLDCHQGYDNNLHSRRSQITCRQCHGGEPMASIQHYYSLMNPIRRHAYVCAKCHQGASASFATYVIHEPAAEGSEAQRTFPALYYAYWFMLLLLAITLAFFIPHSLLIGLRELLGRRKAKDGGEKP